jgi:hypothetical protein
VDALHDADAGDAFRLESGDSLVDEVDRRDRECDGLSLVEGALNDVRRSQGLAEPCGSLEHRTTMA